MSRISVALFLLLPTLSVAAGSVPVPSYLTVYKTFDGRSFLIDQKSIKKKGGTRRYVQVIDLGDHNGNEVRSRRSLEEADCKDGKTRTLEETVFDGPVATGKVLREAKEISEWSTEAEGSPGKAILTFVCGQ